MKSQTVARVVIFVGLLAVANAIKPMTAKNIANQLLGSARTLTAVLPESSRGGLEVVHTLAMTIGQSLFVNDGGESYWSSPVEAANQVTLAQAVVQQRINPEKSTVAQPVTVRRSEPEPATVWEVPADEELIGEAIEAEIPDDVQMGVEASTAATESIYLASAASREEEQVRQLVLTRLIKPAMREEINRTLLTVVPQMKEATCQNQEIERQLTAIVELARRKQKEKARDALLQCEPVEKPAEPLETENEGASPKGEVSEERPIEMPVVPTSPLRPANCLVPPQE